MVLFPKIRSDLHFTLQQRKTPQYIVEDPLRGVYFRIGLKEYRFIASLDGNTGFEEALEKTGKEKGDRLEEKDGETILQWLALNQLLTSISDDLAGYLYDTEKRKRKLRALYRLNLITIKIPICNPDPLLQKLAPPLLWIMSGWFFMVWLGICFGGVYAVISNWDLFLHRAHDILSQDNLLLLWICLFGIKIIHEMGHALACLKHGGHVNEAGILFILFIPLTYIDGTSSWRFKSSMQRIHTAIGGVYLEFFVAGCAALYWTAFPDTPAGVIAHNIVLVASVSTLLFNANPLMRFDGYYVLSDILDISNLYARGHSFIQSIFRRCFLGIKTPPRKEDTRTQRIVATYGLMAFVWRIFVLLSLSLGAATLFHGAGIAIAIMAAILWIILPATAFARKIRVTESQIPGTLKKFMLRSGIFAAISASLCVAVPWTPTLECPAVVLYDGEVTVHSQASGFVTKILVHSLEHVPMAQPLIILANPELETELQITTLESRILESKALIALQQKDLSGYQVLRKQLEVLQEREADLQEDAASLTVVSPLEGQIVSHRLDELLGAFVERGDALVRIARTDRKKLSVSIDQEHILAFRNAVGKQVDFLFETHGRPMQRGVLKKIFPRAEQRLLHPALGAPAGGSIDLLTDQQGHHPTSLTPRFTGEISLDENTSPSIRPGLRGIVILSGETRPVGWYLKNSLQRFIHDRLN